ncbi:hypothetical protein HHI36_000144 [Cryptolaemus montrouzieri]|uniref:Uncharacterized protein n=1 Tax=Cryptolaemus montrouzieri TaxID=559131 RepID=A0ABD2P460_9CUCU
MSGSGPEQHRTGIKGFVHRNLVLLVFIPLLASVHWGWYALQQNPRLVHPSERHYPSDTFKKMIKEKWENFTKPKENP